MSSYYPLKTHVKFHRKLTSIFISSLLHWCADSPGRSPCATAYFNGGDVKLGVMQRSRMLLCCVLLYVCALIFVNSGGKTNPGIRGPQSIVGFLVGHACPCNLAIDAEYLQREIQNRLITTLNRISFLAGMWKGNSTGLEQPGWSYNNRSLWVLSSLWLQKDQTNLPAWVNCYMDSSCFNHKTYLSNIYLLSWFKACSL